MLRKRVLKRGLLNVKKIKEKGKKVVSSFLTGMIIGSSIISLVPIEQAKAYTVPIYTFNINQVVHHLQNAVADEAVSEFNSFLAQFGISIPSFLKSTLEGYLRALASSVFCFIPHLTADLLLNLPLPNSFSLPLFCGGSYSVNLSPSYAKALTTAKGYIGQAIGEDTLRCLQNPTDPYCLDVYKAFLKGDSAFLVGSSPHANYAQKTIEEVKQEYKEKVKSLAVKGVDLSSADKVIYTPLGTMIRQATMNDAGTTYNTLVAPSKEQARKIPNKIKPYYNYVAEKQFQRKNLVDAYMTMIDREKRKLAEYYTALQGFCNLNWTVDVIPAIPSIGGLVKANNLPLPNTMFANITPNSNFLEKKLQKDLAQLQQKSKNLAEQFKEYIEQITKKNNEKLNNPKLALADTIKDNIKSRVCSCSCFCVISAENHIISNISLAKVELEATIVHATEVLASVIALELFKTRAQIDADAYASTKALLNYFCSKAQLDFQRNYILLLNAEIQTAILRALYGLLDKIDYDLLQKKLNEYFKTHP